MLLGVGGDPDREVARVVTHDLHQLEGVGEITTGVGTIGGRVTPEGEDVVDPAGGVGVEQIDDVGLGVADTGEVGHGREVVFAVEADDGVAGAVAGGAERAIGHRCERRVDHRQLVEGLGQAFLGLGVLGRGELEAQRGSGAEEIDDAGHPPLRAWAAP